MLWRNAGRQIAKNPVYKAELNYCFDEKGITVSQGGSVTSKNWDECYKAADYAVLAGFVVLTAGIIVLKKFGF